jgi:hypothetical protein
MLSLTIILTCAFIVSLSQLLNFTTYTNTMSQKALIVKEIGKPLVLVEQPIPVPIAGEVLVKIEATGRESTAPHF